MSVLTIKRLTKLVSRGVSPTYDDSGKARIINQACIYWDGIKDAAMKTGDESIHTPNSRGYLTKGDILVNSTGTGTLGRATVFNIDNSGAFFADSHITILRPNKQKLDSRFAKYLIQTEAFQDKIYTYCVSGSTNQIELSRERFRELEMTDLDVGAQSRIADYLDGKTAIIDKMIATKRRLFDDLESAARASIFSITTKGLIDTQMIDSGERWLGEVPISWYKTYLMGCGFELKKKNLPGNITTLLSLSYGKLITKDIDDNGGLLPESFDTYQLLKSGQTVLRLTDLQNDHRSLRVGYVEQDGMITSAYSCVTPKPNIDSKYLYYYLHSADLRKVFYSMGGGVRQSMKFDDLKRLVMYIPPTLEEQRRIVKEVDRAVEKIVSLQNKVKHSIHLLEEYRSSLISNVVGGKVEV